MENNQQQILDIVNSNDMTTSGGVNKLRDFLNKMEVKCDTCGWKIDIRSYVAHSRSASCKKPKQLKK